MKDKIQEVASALARGKAMALTGAGISVESGIPAFRGAQGLWSKYDPTEYADIEAFRADPVKVWKMLKELNSLVLGAKPNPAHLALAALEAMGLLTLVVTQNIDGLHQAGGNRNVVEYHGSSRNLRCLDCTKLFQTHQVDLAALPPRCVCGGLIKPDVIFFGEAIPPHAHRKATAGCGQCGVMLVVGTSANVAPASHLPVLAKRAGALVVEINPEPTQLSRSVVDYSFQASASKILPMLVQALEQRAATA